MLQDREKALEAELAAVREQIAAASADVQTTHEKRTALRLKADKAT